MSRNSYKLNAQDEKSIVEKLHGYAVYEKEPRHQNEENGVILGPFVTSEEAQNARIKYGYSDDNYYVNSMIRERYNQIVSDVFKNYLVYGLKRNIVIIDDNYILLSKEDFINKCKKDPDFSEKWLLKIEERELSLLERKQIVKNKYFIEFYWKIVDDQNEHNTILEMNKRNIPTQLITITYGEESLEIYE